MNKEGYQPIKTKKTTKIILPNTGSHVQMKKDGYTWEDLDRSYWEGFDVEHFEAYGQCRDSRRIAGLEAENEKLKEQNYKTKVALRNVIDYLGQFCSDYPDCVIKAEQFLKECE